MGSYDTIHTGDRCGQVKCFGKGLGDYHLGDTVALVHPPQDAASYEAWLAGEDRPEQLDERRDFQIAMGEGGWLVVRDGLIASWEDLPVVGLDQLDTLGRPFDPARRAEWGSDPAACPHCARLRGEEPPEPAALGEVDFFTQGS